MIDTVATVVAIVAIIFGWGAMAAWWFGLYDPDDHDKD